MIVNPVNAIHFGSTLSVSRPTNGAAMPVTRAIGTSISAAWVGVSPRATW